MANRYWVGGSGTWDTTTTTNWSASSGGSSGASVPTATDSVFFDQASTYTVTMTGALNCLDITVSAGTVTFQDGTSPTLSVAGSWSTIAGTVWNTTGTVTFTSTSLTSTIDSNGITINSSFTFNKTSATWTLQSNLTLAGTRTCTLTAGTLALSTYTLTTPRFSSVNSNTRTINFGTGKIVLNGSATARVWDTSTITNLTISGTSLVECIGGGTGVTKTIRIGALSEANSISLSLLETTGTVTYLIDYDSSIKDFIINGSQTFTSGSGSGATLNIYGNYTYSTSNGTTTIDKNGTYTPYVNFSATSGTKTLTWGTQSYPWQIAFDGVGGTWQYQDNLTVTFQVSTGFNLVNGTIDFNNKTSSGAWNGINVYTGNVIIKNFSTTEPLTHNSGTLTLGSNITTGTYTQPSGVSTSTLNLSTYTLTVPTFSSSNSNTRTINFGTGKIVLNGSATDTVWTTANTNGLTVLGTPLVECIGGGTGVTKTIITGALSEANSISFSLLETTGTVTYDFSGAAGNIAVDNLTINGNQTLTNAYITIYGSYSYSNTNGTTTFNAGTRDWTFGATSGSYNITSGGLTYDFPWTFNGSGGTWTLQDNLTLASTRTLTLTAGTLALSTYTLTTGAFSSSNSNTRTINFGTGKIVLNGATAATIWTTATTTNLTVTGTPLVESSGGGTAITKTINTGTITEAQAISFSLLETTGTVTYAFTASNGVKNLIINGSQTVSNIAITIYGALTHQTTNGTTTLTAGANAWTFGATSGSYTITNIAGFTYDFPWTFGSASSTATWTLAANLTLGATRQITLTNGTTDFNSKTLSAAGITILTGTPTIANTGTASFTTTLPITHTSGSLTLPFNVTTSSTSGYTFTAGTLALSTYTLTTPIFSSSNSNTRTINFGTGKIVLNGSATATVWTTATVTNLTVSGTPLVECIGGGTGVTKTINTGALSEANSISFSLLETTGTATYTFTASNIVKNLITNGVQTVSNVAITIYGSFTHQTTNGTTTFTTGTNAWTFGATSGSYTITNIAGFTYNFPWTFGSATSTATWTLAANLTLGATRQLTLTNGTTDFNSKTLSAAGITILTGTPTIANTGTASFTTTLPITHTSGSLTLPFNVTTSSTSGYTFTAGTLALSTYTLTTPIFSSNNSSTRTINFGTGKIVLNGSATATVWNMATVTNLTVSGTPLVECIGGGTGVTKTINISSSVTLAQGINFSLLETTGTATYTFTASAGILNLTCNGSQTVTNSSLYLTSFTHQTTNGTTTFSAGTNAWVFWATSGSYTITNIAGFTYDFPWTFGWSSGSASSATWTLAANLTLGATRQLTLATGTLDFNSKTLSAAGITIAAGSLTANIANTGTASFTTTLPITHTSGSFTLPFDVTTSSASGYTFTAGTLTLVTYTLTTPVFVSSGSGTRTLAFGTGQLSLTGNGGSIFDTTTATNFTTTGTVYINSTYTGATGTRTIVTGFTETQASGYDVKTTGTTGIVIGTSATDIVAFTGSFGGFNLTGLTNTVSNTARTIYGNFVVGATGTLTAGTNATTFGSSSTQTISASQNIPFPLTVNSTGTVQLTSNITISNSQAVTLTSGTLDLNNLILTVTSISSSNSNTRAIAFGSTGQLLLNGNNATLANFATMTGFTYTGTANIYSNYSGATGTRTFNFGGTAGATTTNVFDVVIGTSGTGLIINAATDSITFTGSYGSINLTGLTNTITNTNAPTLFGNLTVPASGGTLTAGTNAWILSAPTSTTKTITTNGRTINFPLTIGNGTSNGIAQLSGAITLSSTVGVTLTSGNLDLNDFTFTSNSFTSTNTNYRVLAFKTTGQLTLNGSAGTIWDTTNGSNFNISGSKYVFASTPGATQRTINFGNISESAAFNVLFNTSIQSNSFTINPGTDAKSIIGSTYDLDFTNNVGTLTSGSRTVYGNLVIPATGTTFTATSSPITFATSTLQTIDYNGRSNVGLPLVVNGTGITRLANNITGGSTLTLTTGTLDLNNYTGVFTTFTSSGTGTRTLAFGTSGQLTLTANNTTIVNISTATEFTYTGNPNIISNYSGATGTRIFALGNAAGFTVSGVTNTNNMFDFCINGSNGLIVTGGTDSLSILGQTRDFNFTNVAQTITNQTRSVYGNFIGTTTSTGTVSAGTLITTLAGYSANYSINTNGRLLDFPFTIDGNANYTMSSVIFSIGSTRNFTLNTGNLALSIPLTCGQFVTNSANVRSIAFSGTGRISIQGNSTTIWNSNNGSNFTWTGTPDIRSTYTSNVGTRTIDFGNIAESYSFNVQTANGNGFALNTANDTINISGSINSLDLTSFTGTVTNSTRTIYGNLTIPASNGTHNTGTLVTTFGATSGTKTIDTSGRTLQFPLTFNGAGGNWTLANNLVANTTTVLTLTNGQVDFNQKSLTFANITILTGNAALSNLNTSLAMIHTSGNLNIKTGAITSTTSNTYTLTAGSLQTDAAFSTGAFTQNGGNIILNGGDLTCTTLTSNNSTTRSIQFGTSNINVTSTGTVVNMTTTTNLTSNGSGNINITSSGSTAITVTPGSLAEANAMSYNFTGGTYGLTITAGSVENLNFTGYAGTITNTALTVYGNMTVSTGMTLTAGTNALTFAKTSTQTLTSNGKTFDFPVVVNGVGGTLQLVDALTIGSTRTLTLSNGTINLNGLTLTTNAFATTSGTQNITFNNGTLTVTGSGATIFNNISSNLTTTLGNANGTISMTSASAKTFVGGNANYSGATLNQGGTGLLTVTGNNTFNDLAASITATANATISFTAGTTTTFTNFTLQGNTTYQPTINSATVGTKATFYSASGLTGYVTGSNYLICQDIAFTPFIVDGTDYIRWYIGANSNVVNNVSGALAQTYTAGVSYKVYVLESGSSWVTPSDFNVSDNIIHLYGGGGGGGSFYAGTGTKGAGGGGGGGGYTQIINFYSYSGQSIPVSIGSKGIGATTNPANGTAGGSTSFTGFSAGGGGGGVITSSAATGGSGGIGTTYTGGAGGAGGRGGGSDINSGGGGGGAAGPSGNGGAGGAGAALAGVGDLNGGGGGGNGGGAAGAAAGNNGGGGGGGNNILGYGGGIAPGGIGTAGGGGAGGRGAPSTAQAGVGGTGIDILNSIGGGGGGGGGAATSSGAVTGGIGGKYGGGGGGGGKAFTTSNGADGAQGVIIIQYIPGTAPPANQTQFFFAFNRF